MAHLIKRATLVGAFTTFVVALMLTIGLSLTGLAGAQTTPEPTPAQTTTPEPTATQTATPQPTATQTTTPQPTATQTTTPQPTATQTTTPQPTPTPPSGVCVMGGKTFADTRATAGDCRALDALRLSMPSPVWQLESLTDPCKLPGVGCWSASSRISGVRVISLTGRPGTIPPEIGEFTSIRNMTLASNRLTGAIPEELGKLTTLETLKISNEGLTGPLPASLGSLTNLTSLVISQTGITGGIPAGLGALTQLDTLNLANNRIDGPIPDVFAAMTSLQYANLNGNRLTGTVPASLGGSASLVNLLVADNDLSGDLGDGIFAPSSGPSKILNINLRGNELTGQFPSTAFGPAVRSLDASDNKFSGALTFPEAGAPELVNVDLSGNALTGAIPAAMFTSPKIGDVDLANNALTGELPQTLAQATNLRRLNVSNNKLEGSIPTIGSTTKLRSLRIDGNEMSGEIPSDFPAVSDLRLLPNGCFETDDAGVKSYLAGKGYREPYGPCAAGDDKWEAYTASCPSRESTTGTIGFRAANPSDQAFTTKVDFLTDTGLLYSTTITVPPGGSATGQIIRFPNSNYTVSARIGSNIIYRGTGVFDCSDGGGEVGDRPSAVPSVVCLAGNSRVDVKLVNTTATPQSFSVKIGTSVTREATVAADSNKTVSVYGLPDGPVTVVPTIPGLTLDASSVGVNCTSSLTKPIEAVASCMAGPYGISRGRFDVAIRNTSSSRSVFTLQMDLQLANGTRSSIRSKTLSSNQLWQLVVPNVADGTYKLSVRQGGVALADLGTLDVSCSAETPAPQGGIRVITSCLAGNARGDVFIQNTGTTAATYSARFGTSGVEKSIDLAPNGRGRLVVFNGTDGLGPVTVKRDGVEAYSEPVPTSPCS